MKITNEDKYLIEFGHIVDKDERKVIARKLYKEGFMKTDICKLLNIRSRTTLDKYLLNGSINVLKPINKPTKQFKTTSFSFFWGLIKLNFKKPIKP